MTMKPSTHLAAEVVPLGQLLVAARHAADVLELSPETAGAVTTSRPQSEAEQGLA